MSIPDKLPGLRDTAQWLVETARKLGADTADAHVSHSREFELEVRDGEKESLSEAESSGASLTISKDGRRASVQSSDTRHDHLQELVEKALFLCRYTDLDEAYRLPPKDRLAVEIPDLDLFDANLADMAVDRKVDLALRSERAMLAQDPRLNSNGASFSDGSNATASANSLGFSATVHSTMAGISVSGFADDAADGDLNTGRKQASGWYSQARHISDMETAETVGQRAASDILRLLGARKPETGKFPVYFEPSTARSLWQHLLGAINGSRVYRDESYLAGRVGQQVAHPSVTITDNPLKPRGLASHPYDDEGVACKPSTLILNGQLQTYLLSTYSATKLGLETTGHAGGPGNIIIQPGTQTEEEMIRSIPRGVWITSLSGQGVNVGTGDYSRGAQGLWIEQGQVAYPILEFTINGTLMDMFQRIAAIGLEPERGRSILTPGVLIEEMTISGS